MTWEAGITVHNIDQVRGGNCIYSLEEGPVEERVPKFQDGGKFMHRHDGLEWRERGSSGNQCAVMQGHREAFIKVSLSTTTKDEKKRWRNLDSFKVVIIKIAKISDIAPSAAA